MTDLEQHDLARSVATLTSELAIAPRWYPHGERGLLGSDKSEAGPHPFGRNRRAAAENIDQSLLAALTG